MNANSQNMETPGEMVDTLFESAEEYGKSTYELLRLKAIERVATVTSSMATQVLFLALVSMFVFALTIALGFLIGEALGKVYYGFFIVAGAYLLLGLIAHFALRKWLHRLVANSIVKEIFE